MSLIINIEKVGKRVRKFLYLYYLLGSITSNSSYYSYTEFKLKLLNWLAFLHGVG